MRACQLTTLEAARALLAERAGELEVGGADGAAIEALLERELRTPEPTEEDCRRYFEHNAARFRAGARVQASHILFMLTPRVPPGALRATAEEVHAAAMKDAARFEELARRWSNCPSARQGGSLGWVRRGEAIPEFEAALFAEGGLGVLPELVTTRYGFHVVLVKRRVAGRAVPFEEARGAVEAFLREHSTRYVLRQYLQVLAEGFPLVQ